LPTHRRLVIGARNAETRLFSLVSAGARENASAKALGGANKEIARMRLVTYSIVGAACALGILFPPIASKAANVPLCLAIAQNYNACIRQHQHGRGGHGGYGPGYGQGYGHDYEHGYGRGYGHGYGNGYRRGYPGEDFGGDPGDYDGGGGYGGYGGGSRHHHERDQAACAVWFAQMQASGCFN
jgi:hypothetical protein